METLLVTVGNETGETVVAMFYGPAALHWGTACRVALAALTHAMTDPDEWPDREGITLGTVTDRPADGERVERVFGQWAEAGPCGTTAVQSPPLADAWGLRLGWFARVGIYRAYPR